MPTLTYAVHTESCTYLLDDEGVCRWVVSPTGVMHGAAAAAVGAQFVACLDLRLDGGLAGSLVVGGHALFAKLEDGRHVLLRTTPITHVETRGLGSASPPPPKSRPKPPTPRASGVTETITLVKPFFRAPPAPKVPKDMDVPRPPPFRPATLSPPSYRSPSGVPVVPAPPKPRKSARVDGPKKRR